MVTSIEVNGGDAVPSVWLSREIDGVFVLCDGRGDRVTDVPVYEGRRHGAGPYLQSQLGW
jgi:hypothetical protein